VLGLGNSSPSTAREEEKTRITSARLTIFVVTPTRAGKRVHAADKAGGRIEDQHAPVLP